MKSKSFVLVAGLSGLALLSTYPGLPAHSQTPTPRPAAVESNLLSDDELEVLVARIALYPDELVAAISAASLLPLQVVEADRFLQARQKDKDLKPNDGWDGSVISLLNYPDIVKMMSEDLAWTQSLGNALTYQQKDVLIAIQQLREEAVAKDVIKTDEKITVVVENENVVIRPTDPEKIYLPQYPPQMLYEPGYAAQPISYHDDYYDSYYYPGAAFFAGAVTGIAWAAIVNWDDWGVWGGNWGGGDLDIDCNNCFNDRNFNGKLKLKDVDWSKVDRSKLGIGKDTLAGLDRSAIKSGLVSDNRNALKNQVRDRKASDGLANRPNSIRPDDVRRNTTEGLKQNARQAGNRAAENRPAAARNNQAANRPAAKARNSSASAARSTKKAGAPKMAARPDNRARQPNALGNVQPGRREAVSSKRGAHSMGGGQRGGPRAAPRGGGRPMHHGGGGRGGRGGGGRR
ncbi:Protein of unknown function [Rhizobium sp. NFR07]|uniref:DUF3300 domain-containing protein n=1 Tax=Rhizobium sp. NFR07 TaxID=1566262 RepID=UPI0008DEC947|nr:DUF3300 domain-containing protein [Rhizobium sp. NFR07]SFA81979.1 Protein of unknown function [Rhizobium sp. NFR07]